MSERITLFANDRIFEEDKYGFIDDHAVCSYCYSEVKKNPDKAVVIRYHNSHWRTRGFEMEVWGIAFLLPDGCVGYVSGLRGAYGQGEINRIRENGE